MKTAIFKDTIDNGVDFFIMDDAGSIFDENQSQSVAMSERDRGERGSGDNASLLIDHSPSKVYSPNVVLKLGQHLRRWPNIRTTLGTSRAFLANRCCQIFSKMSNSAKTGWLYFQRGSYGHGGGGGEASGSDAYM